MPYDFYYKPTKPKEAKDGIKARSRRGAFAKNWWAKRWIAALELLLDQGRLNRGRNYARKGQVLSIEETREGIKARVQGSRKTPYKINIQIKPLSQAQWSNVIDQLAEQAIFAAQLLAGEMPQEIESAFEAAGVNLFPSQRDDLETECSCPDYANPCKHIAATHYILGERFDEDPFLIFRLRGMTKEQVMEELRNRRAEDNPSAEQNTEEPAPPIPLTEQITNYYDLSGPMEEFSISILPPAIEMPLLKRLGQADFVPAPGLEKVLQKAYQTITQKAIEVAFYETDNKE